MWLGRIGQNGLLQTAGNPGRLLAGGVMKGEDERRNDKDERNKRF